MCKVSTIVSLFAGSDRFSILPAPSERGLQTSLPHHLQTGPNLPRSAAVRLARVGSYLGSSDMVRLPGKGGARQVNVVG